MKKDLLLIAIIAAVVIAVCLTCEIRTPDAYYLEHLKDVTADTPSVGLVIRCETAIPYADGLAPAVADEVADGMILEQKQYVLRAGDTVYDVLNRALRHYRIQVEYDGGYVRGLGYLYEFDCGELSGWVFLVNGERVGSSCKDYRLRDGDRITWAYSCDLGRDIEEVWHEAV